MNWIIIYLVFIMMSANLKLKMILRNKLKKLLLNIQKNN
jgi:hypothetical protein